MTRSTPAPRRVARAIAAALWAVGSAYLIKTEIGTPSPDYVVIVATPIVWLAVIVLPILSHHAIKERQWLAGALLAIAAIVGSAYTLSGTLARSSEARDARVAQAAAQTEQRADIERQRREAGDMLDGAQKRLGSECRSGRGARCRGIETTISVYTAAIAGHDAALARLKIESPAAGERRIAAAIAMLPWTRGSADDYAEAVGLFLPALLGIALEIGALAAAMYGWHGSRQHHSSDTAQTSYASTAADLDALRAAFDAPTPPRPPRGGKPVLVASSAAPTDHPLIAELKRGGPAASQDELAGRLGLSKGEVSKTVSELADRLTVSKRGRCNRIALVACRAKIDT